jgi:hypothetical protein
MRANGVRSLSFRLPALLAGGLALTACQGGIANDADGTGEQDGMGSPLPGRPGSPGGSGSGTMGTPGTAGTMGTTGAPTPPPPVGKMVPHPDIARMNGAIGARRLTRFEYGNTVADLLGVKGSEVDIEDDDAIGFLTNNQNALRVGLADLEAYERAANKIATTSLPTLPLPMGCTADAATADCVTRFLNEFLPRAFRRPPIAAETMRYVTLFNQLVAADGSKAEALRGVVQAVLQSPSFLYRTELGTDGKTLTAWELASRLSYFVWGTMPDAELFAKAKDESLKNRAVLEAQLKRLLADPRAQKGAQNVIFEWFGMIGTQLAKKGADITKGLSLSSLQTAIEEEARRYVNETLVAAGGSFEALYGSKFSFVNDGLAALYGVKGITGTTMRKVDLDATQRRGLFTQPLLLASHTKESGYSVVQMGRFVRERLLCQHVPPPPEMVNTELKDTPATANLTYRQKFEQHATESACKGCHNILDPPGYAFLSYDPVGRFKKADPAGVPFDTKGDLLNVDGGAIPFTDAPTMLDGIRASQDAKACFARKLTEYAFGRTLSPADVPLYQRLVWRLEAKGDFAAFLADIVLSNDFGLRGPDETNI